MANLFMLFGDFVDMEDSVTAQLSRTCYYATCCIIPTKSALFRTNPLSLQERYCCV